MAETKKTAGAKSTAKAGTAKATDAKEDVIVEAADEVTEAPKAETKKTAAKRTTAKKTTAAKKATAEKKTATEKKATTTRRSAKKVESEAVVQLQFAGKAYTTEDLIKSAKDIWEYDLNRKPEDFKKVALYVKPEESMVYYVVNDEVEGSFEI